MLDVTIVHHSAFAVQSEGRCVVKFRLPMLDGALIAKKGVWLMNGDVATKAVEPAAPCCAPSCVALTSMKLAR